MADKQPYQRANVSQQHLSIPPNQVVKGRSWVMLSLLVGQIGLLGASAEHSQAQQIAQMLPPPPSVIAIPSSDVRSTAFTTPPASAGETIFQAPSSSDKANVRRYIVYVNGDSSYLLQEVRAIEPGAFVQQYQDRRIIQVGTFSNEANAQQQIATLNARGIMAEVMSINSPPTLTRTSRYLVVIPSNRDQLSTLKDQVIRLGVRPDAIQEKEVPLGPHLEIGPFGEHSEAKDVSQFLRNGGLDSRVYYSR